MFATVLAEIRGLHATCNEIRLEVKKTNGRVIGLERFRDVLTAKVAMISVTLGFAGGAVAWLGKIIFWST